MDYVFIGPVLLPITPERIEQSNPGANKTIRLINDGEINVRHSPGLKTYTFDVILPSSQSYPFQIYKLAGFEAVAFKTYFEELHNRKIPFPFIQVSFGGGLTSSVIGMATGALQIAYGNVLCTIEEMTVLRSADNGQDYVISLSLKEYRDYGTKYVKQASEDTDGNVTYKVSRQTSSYSYIAELNKLSNEIVSKLGVTGATAASLFKLASDTIADPIGAVQNTYNSSKEFLGW